MNENLGNNQTTQGIWVSINKKFKTIIIDCEGTDSKERGENRLQFENCSSLFCLALSDVLLMNMWTQDVGRYTASNYSVLKMVFEMNLRLFEQRCAKKIIVVLRDYSEKRFKIKSIFEDAIMKDITSLWNEIKKPDKYKNSTPLDFFAFEFVTLPHKQYEEEKFDHQIGLFRERLLPDHKEYLFDHSQGGKDVPIDGYVAFCASVWETIINEKDLNIPSQKEMLGIYRCNELKDEAYNFVKEDIQELNMKSKSSKIQKYSETVMRIYNNSLNKYNKVACNYMEKIFLEVQTSLKKHLIHELYVSFINQINRIIPTSLKFFGRDLEKELKNSNFLLIFSFFFKLLLNYY